MATDTFLDLLAPTAARAPKQRFSAKQLAEADKAITHYLDATRAIRKPDTAPTPFGPTGLLAKHRPDFADDIDHIVADMVAAGLVVFDQATDSYRRPHVRRWRFA